MQLSAFIASYISNDYRTGRDFSGARGWIALTNLVLKRFESKGYFTLDRNIQVGVEVDYLKWIQLPSDCRKVLSVKDPVTMRDYRYEIINSKIKLTDITVEKESAPSSFILSSFVTGSVAINDTDATEDLWKDYLLVASTKKAIVAANTVAAGGLSTLMFYNDVSLSVPMPTTGYLTKQYLLLDYQKSFTGLTSSSDEVPIDDKFESIIAQAIIVELLDKKNKGFANEYQIYRDLLSDFESEEFTPDPGSARPRPRALPGYNDCSDFEDSEYIGEEE